MTGSVRKRQDGAYWEYVIEAGRRTRWTCTVDGCRWGTWSPIEGDDDCPRHPDAATAQTVRRRQVSRSGFARKRDAEKAMRVALVDLDGTVAALPAASSTLGEYLTREWLPSVETRVKPATYRQYRQMVRLHIVPRLGPVALRDLETAHLDRLYAELLRSGRRVGDGGLAPKTVRHVHVVLRAALGDAVRRGRASRDPPEHASPPKLRRKDLQVWDRDQLHAFLEHTADDPLIAAWTLLATTGMRRGEVCGVRWSDVDLPARAVTVNQQITSVDGARHHRRAQDRAGSPHDLAGRRDRRCAPRPRGPAGRRGHRGRVAVAGDRPRVHS